MPDPVENIERRISAARIWQEIKEETEAEKRNPAKLGVFNPWILDSKSSASHPPALDSHELDASESLAVQAAAQTIDLAKLTPWQLRQLDSCSSALEGTEQTNPEATAEEEEAEVSPKWFEQVTKMAKEVWQRLVSYLKPAEKMEQQSDPVEDALPTVTPQKITTLSAAPKLEKPIATFDQEKLAKLQNELSVACQQMEEAATINTDELQNRSDTDVIVWYILKGTNEKQGSNSKLEETSRVDIHQRTLEDNKRLRDEINDVRNHFNKLQPHSKNLKWVNIATTILAVVGGIVAFLIPGVGPLAAIGTAAGILGSLSSVAGGSMTIAKGVIDYKLNRDKGTISLLMSNRQLNNIRLEVNLNELERLISSMHLSDEMIIAALALQRDTIRFAQS